MNSKWTMFQSLMAFFHAYGWRVEKNSRVSKYTALKHPSYDVRVFLGPSGAARRGRTSPGSPFPDALRQQHIRKGRELLDNIQARKDTERAQEHLKPEPKCKDRTCECGYYIIEFSGFGACSKCWKQHPARQDAQS